ncbi:unnamed protein product [Sphagnum tenellum]
MTAWACGRPTNLASWIDIPVLVGVMAWPFAGPFALATMDVPCPQLASCLVRDEVPDPMGEIRADCSGKDGREGCRTCGRPPTCCCWPSCFWRVKDHWKMICWDCGPPGVGNPSLAHAVGEGQAFTDAESRENEVEVEKDLAVAFFVAAIAVVYTALSHGALEIARLGAGGDFSAAAVKGTHAPVSWHFCALNYTDNLH